jgi:uncharacterized membrane protein YfcA
MSLTMTVILLAVGLAIGLMSGMIGIGGGILIIPVLTLGLGFTQARANGTSLAMLLPPVGILAVLIYARAGNIDWRVAILLAIGFTAGAAIGGILVNRGLINPTALRILFGVLLLYVAGRTLFRTGGQARTALETTLLVAGVTMTYAVLKKLGRHWGSGAGYYAAVYRLRHQPSAEFDYEI